MDTSLSRLQSATEFVLLGNSENMLDQQRRLNREFSEMQQELRRNDAVHRDIAANQIAMFEKQDAKLEDISDETKALRKDFQKLLSFMQTSKPGEYHDVKLVEQLSANVVRHFYGNVLASEDLPFPDTLAILVNLEKSQVEETGSWLFEHPFWLDWVDWSRNSSPVLWLVGRPGIGKTYLSLSVYQQLCRLRNPEHEVCIAYFRCCRPDRTGRHMRNILRNCAIQIADQSPALRQRLEAMWRNYEIMARVIEAGDEKRFSQYSKDIDIFVYDNFSKGSKNQLFVVVDGINEFYDEEREAFYEVVRKIEGKELSIKFVVTSDYDVGDKISSKTIEIGKEQILPDLRKMLWTKLNSDDSAYDGLRRLSKHNKQQVARVIQQNAKGKVLLQRESYANPIRLAVRRPDAPFPRKHESRGQHPILA